MIRPEHVEQLIHGLRKAGLEISDEQSSVGASADDTVPRTAREGVPAAATILCCRITADQTLCRTRSCPQGIRIGGALSAPPH